MEDKFDFERNAYTFDEYQDNAVKTAVFPGDGEIMGLAYTALGVCGEAGEIAEKVKKLWRDKGGYVSPEDSDALLKECGDVLWYITNLLKQLNRSLEEAAVANNQKLLDRMDRNVLQGSGDNR